ncbi:CcdC family protein [Halalkalibacillus halophilus]|uniref:CcdC family protein n=1 Tax=Halalkalibacillus halophilus TaxID=392827 RepID=UPI0003F891B2|nr:cytochrome c biogenesis protein CcdC [Halalkalibacillus halophilus]
MNVLDQPLIAGTISVIAVIMAIGMIVIRSRAAKRPASVKKIILPPFFMSTGALMFLFPYFQISWLQVIEAMIVGVLFSILLIYTSNFEVKKNEIYLKPSKALAFILVGLLVIRVSFKSVLGQEISVGETSAMFFLLAFAMLVTWRIAMLIKFMKLKNQIA